MRILLTGASGFVGRQVLASLISMGADVHAVSRRRPQVDGPFIWHEADLLSPDAASMVIGECRPACVLHLAWCVEHGRFWTDPANLDWIAATVRIARAAADMGVTRFVGAGTCYEYDWPADGYCDEKTTPLAVHTLYDASKSATRQALRSFFDNMGVSFAWARLFFLYGQHEPPGRLVSSLAIALAAGQAATCSRGLAMRDFMNVRDAGRAIATLALSRVEGSVNIGSGEGVRIADLATRMGELAGKPDLVRLGALPDRPGEPPRIVARTERLYGEVGFHHVHPLEVGLRDALAYWETEARL